MQWALEPINSVNWLVFHVLSRLFTAVLFVLSHVHHLSKERLNLFRVGARKVKT